MRIDNEKKERWPCLKVRPRPSTAARSAAASMSTTSSAVATLYYTGKLRSHKKEESLLVFRAQTGK